MATSPTPPTPSPFRLATSGGAPREAIELRLVVVDNDSEALDLLVMDLKLEGHDIVGTAFGGDGALELCRELNPDALVVDYRMPPGPNGVQTAANVHAELPDLRVVIYTNYINADVARGARKAGAILIEKGNLRALRRALVDAGQ